MSIGIEHTGSSTLLFVGPTVFFEVLNPTVVLTLQNEKATCRLNGLTCCSRWKAAVRFLKSRRLGVLLCTLV